MEEYRVYVLTEEYGVVDNGTRTGKYRDLESPRWALVEVGREPEDVSKMTIKDGVLEPATPEDVAKWAEKNKEHKSAVLRLERDNALKATDKFAVADYPFSSEEEKTAIYQYRQALRDLPQSADFPNVELPTPPDVLIIKKND